MFKQNEKSIAQIAEYIPRACRGMQLQEAKARLEKKIALYIDDGCDAAVLNAAFAPALNSHTRESFFFVHRSADPQRRQPVSESKCQINGNKIEPCAALAKSLEHDAEYTARKGLLIYKIWNESLTRGPDLVMLRSGEFSKSPVRVSFCPFCGESLKTWENRNE